MYDIYMEKLREKLYQMFILGLEGDSLKDERNLQNALKSGLGGVIFFTRNILSRERFKKLICQINETAKIPPLLSIDQEGGRVERTENLFGGKKYLSARFAAERGADFLRAQTENIALELRDFGINLNFAPCIDVNTNPQNPIIGERAFSSNPDKVAEFGAIVAETYLKNGIIPCSKHFPGHGDASADSHISLPEIDLSLEEMEKFHISPFKEVKTPMVMVAHLHCKCFDEEKIPSSLSKNVISYLRENLGYDGVIITDDMVMGGVLGVDGTRACELAIKAGVNILLYRDSDDKTVQIVENLAKLAETDDILKKNIENSFEKISVLKCNYVYRYN